MDKNKEEPKSVVIPILHAMNEASIDADRRKEESLDKYKASSKQARELPPGEDKDKALEKSDKDWKKFTKVQEDADLLNNATAKIEREMGLEPRTREEINDFGGRRTNPKPGFKPPKLKRGM